MYDHYNRNNLNISRLLVVGAPDNLAGFTQSITLNEVKTHIRFLNITDTTWEHGSEEDAYLTQCLMAGADAVANFTRYPNLLKTYKVTVDVYDVSAKSITLPLPAVASVISVANVVAGLPGVAMTTFSTNIQNDYVTLTFTDEVLPTRLDVTLNCGFHTLNPMPFDIKQVILSVAAQFYEHRGDMYLKNAMDWPLYHVMLSWVRYPDHWNQTGLMQNISLVVPDRFEGESWGY